MTTHKTFKRRVRARMAKTGEAYTTARSQIVRKADARADGRSPDDEPARAGQRGAAAEAELPVSDASLREASGHGWDHWFRLLDDWDATKRNHTEIARWLRDEQGVGSWWSQSITGGYERARGMRAKHQFAQGFAVSATRTVARPIDQAMAGFTSAAVRRRWLPDASFRQRQTKAANALLLDWPDPPSRITVWFSSKGEARTTITLEHSHLPDGETAERFKSRWRERLAELKLVLEKD